MLNIIMLKIILYGYLKKKTYQTLKEKKKETSCLWQSLNQQLLLTTETSEKHRFELESKTIELAQIAITIMPLNVNDCYEQFFTNLPYLCIRGNNFQIVHEYELESLRITFIVKRFAIINFNFPYLFFVFSYVE